MVNPGRNADLIRWSEAAARELLADAGSRLAYVEAVALRAEQVAGGAPR
jgi:hypothetical protein